MDGGSGPDKSSQPNARHEEEMVPEMALQAISPEELRTIALFYSGVKNVLLRTNGGDGLALDEAFEAVLHRNITDLELTLSKGLDPSMVKVEVVKVKQSIYDEIFQLLARAAMGADAPLGSQVGAMRGFQQSLGTEMVGIWQELQDVLNSLRYDLEDSFNSRARLEDDCERLVETNERLNSEVEEQAQMLVHLQSQLLSAREVAAATRFKDKTRKSITGASTSMAIKSGMTLADKPMAGLGILGRTNLAITPAMAVGLGLSSHPPKPGMVPGLVKAVGEKMAKVVWVEKESASAIHASSVNELEKTVAAAVAGKDVENLATHKVTKNDRADSSLDWLLKHRQEIQVIEDTHAETKKLLSLANCLSTIKQIYQEKEKFERRVAAVKEKARLAEKNRKDGQLTLTDSATAGGEDASSAGVGGDRDMGRTSQNFLGKDMTVLSGKGKGNTKGNTVGVPSSSAVASTSTSTAPNEDTVPPPPQETMERFVFRMLDKRFGYRKLAMEHAGTLLASLNEYGLKHHEAAVFLAIMRGHIDEGFQVMVGSLTESISNLVLAKVRATHPTKGHDFYMKEMASIKGGRQRVQNLDWKEIVEYLFDGKDVELLNRRILETSVRDDMLMGIISEEEGKARLVEKRTKLVEPMHQGKLGYLRPTEPSYRMRSPPPQHVNYDLVENQAVLFLLEKRILSLLPIRHIFDVYDHDSDCILSRKEFQAFLKHVFNKAHESKIILRKTDNMGRIITKTLDASQIADTNQLIRYGAKVVAAKTTEQIKKQDLADDREILKMISAFDPFHVDRITFSTSVSAYLKIMPEDKHVREVGKMEGVLKLESPSKV